MQITVNGAPREVTDSGLPAALEQLGFGGRRVVVERNGEPVITSQHDRITLVEGDKLEVVQAVAGG